MKKFVTLTTLMMLTSVSAATAGPIDWVRENLFPVQIIERIVEKIVPVTTPAPNGWMIWAILIGVVLLLLRGMKVAQVLKDRMPVFPKKSASMVAKEETPPAA